MLLQLDGWISKLVGVKVDVFVMKGGSTLGFCPAQDSVKRRF